MAFKEVNILKRKSSKRSRRKESYVETKKKEYEQILNGIFETDIKWKRLSIEDLEKLTNILSDSEKVIKVTLKLVDFEDLAEKMLKKIIKSQLSSRPKINAILESLKIIKNEIVEKL